MEAIAPWHVAVVVAAALVLFFGWRRLPAMSRSLGRSLRIFKHEVADIRADGRQVHAVVRGTAQETRRQLDEAVEPVLSSRSRAHRGRR